MKTLRIATWNIERKGPQSWQSQEMLATLKKFEPQISCITEGWEGSTSALGGHEICGRGVYWSEPKMNERKVVLQSNLPWSDIDEAGKNGCEYGGFVAGTTITSVGKIRIVGVCIPYKRAWPHLQPIKSPDWQEHRRFLCGLEKLIQEHNFEIPLIILGDFNQRSPRSKYGNKSVYGALISALKGQKIVTEGEEHGLIDHIAVSEHFSLKDLCVLSKYGTNGDEMSDHVGVVCDLNFDSQE